ncbi:MAG: XisI protein [Cytophagales bacterium]|nr:MAG: XisI protein [Cytophagales bacterium]
MNNKIETYQPIVFSLLEQYAQHRPVNVQEFENEVVADRERNHFQLASIGWEKDGRFFHNVIFHFDIKPDGKIWIQVNNTDVDIAAELVERGVSKSDIVIGFQPPRYRPYSGYAVA